MGKFIALCFLVSAIFTSSAYADKKDLGESVQPNNYYPRVQFETTLGNITVELNRRRAPITVNNFLRYVKIGQYDNTIFHRIVYDYIIQGGGYSPEFELKMQFAPIFNESGNGLKNEQYSIAMARQSDPHSAVRQFFFNAQDNDNLDPGKDWGYTVFGYVVEGTELIDKMAVVETELNMVSMFSDVPVEPIILKKVTILPEA
ncbi:peptidylprolyl isomerase [Glaciecola sp. 1036]|uniref:peptidylprolyl isomerase n=1 Tax=Alteromonadaceae TaxID=72275 RepID=UPI003D050888